MQDRNARDLSTTGYTARKTLLALFVLTYAVVAFWGGKTSPRGEFFPVFNWSLFTYVKPERSLLELYVLRIGDRTFERPVNYFELDAYFPSARQRSTDLRKTMEGISNAAQHGDREQLERLRRVLETRHLSGQGPVLYEIRRVKFRPLQRWRTGKVISHELKARIQTRETQ
jgi:hypothetical protein